MDMYHLTKTATNLWSVGLVCDGDAVPSRLVQDRIWTEESGPQCETWVAVAPAVWVEAWAVAHATDFEPGSVVPGTRGPSMVSGVIYEAMQSWIGWLDDERVVDAFGAQDRSAMETILWCEYGVYGADASSIVEATFDLLARESIQ